MGIPVKNWLEFQLKDEIKIVDANWSRLKICLSSPECFLSITKSNFTNEKKLNHKRASLEVLWRYIYFAISSKQATRSALLHVQCTVPCKVIRILKIAKRQKGMIYIYIYIYTYKMQYNFLIDFSCSFNLSCI